MSYAIIRNANIKAGSVPLMERHNERRNKNYSNKDIDLSRSHLNYHLKQIREDTYYQEFERVRSEQGLLGNLRLTGKKQSSVMCEFLITSDKAFFDKLGEEQTKRFFEDAYEFVKLKVGGERFVVSGIVHLDEATPHLHVAYIPVIKGLDRKKNPCERINCSEFWKGKDSYSKLQDEYFAFITARNYDLERGRKGSTAEHLSVLEYKKEKRCEEVEELDYNIAKNETTLCNQEFDIHENEKKIASDKAELDKIAKKKVDIESVENIEVKKALIGNKVTINADDFENLQTLAQKQIATVKTTKKLKSEVAELKESNSKLTAENAKLKEHSQGIIHLQLENGKLKNELSALKNTVAKIYDFIERLDSRERLEEFFNPPKLQRKKSHSR